MTRRIAGIAAAVAIMSCAGVASAQDKTVIDHGIKIYEQQKCGVCHSIAGKGNAKGPLDGVGSRLTLDDIREWIVDPKTMTAKTKAPRKPLMKAYPNLPEADLAAVIAYMQSLKAK